MENEQADATHDNQEQNADYSETDPIKQDDTESTKDDKFIRITKKAISSTEKIIEESYKKAKSASRAWSFDPNVSIKFLDRLLNWARTMFPAEKFESLAAWCIRYGHAAFVVAQVLALLFFLAAAFKLSNWVYLLCGIGFAIFLAILQYTANKFLNAGPSLIQSSPSKLGSDAFPDCLALLVEVAGILIFLKFTLDARIEHQWNLVLVGLGIWALCESVAYVALNPKMVNISISNKISAGEEAIGILSFFVKAMVRIVPIAFGIGTIIGNLALLFAIFTPMSGGLPVAGISALGLIIACGCLPFASYVIFAFYHLILDILQSILGKNQKD